MSELMESFYNYLGKSIQEASKTLSAFWLARLEEVLSIARSELFPSQDLLDHIPRLFTEIGRDLEAFDSEAHFSLSLIHGKSRELGELRFSQKASMHQLLREYAILGSILEEFLEDKVRQLEIQPPLESVLGATHRLNHDVYFIMQTTVDTFVDLHSTTIADQQTRLRSFNKVLGHELRKPLQSILSYAELLSFDKQMSTTARSHALTIISEVGRLSNTLRNLEQISVVEEATPNSLLSQQVDLESIVKDIFQQTNNEADSRGVELRGRPPFSELKVETGKLDLVLRNLVDNSIKYSDPLKKNRYVEIYQRVDDAHSDYVTLCVQDNGIGIPDDELDNIFTMFHRAHANKDDMLNVTGYGIGLSVVKEALQRLGGTIAVESEVGQGTTFSIRLPRGTKNDIILSILGND